MYSAAHALRKWSLGLSVLTVLASGCASMSQQECAATDWQTVGYEDGVNGYSGGRIARYRTACSKYGVAPDLARYQAGREQGLREFCRSANGYRLGAAGGSYRSVCPNDLEAPFLSAFNAGHELYTLQARVWSTDAQLDARRRELRSGGERWNDQRAARSGARRHRPDGGAGRPPAGGNPSARGGSREL